MVHWFQRHRAMALALLMTGTAAGGLMQPIVVPAMEEFGWRSAAFVSGLIVIVAGVPLALVVRHRPEDHGYRVDGGPPPEEAGATHTATPEVSFTVRQALRTRAFWFLAIGHGMAALVIGSIFVHFQVYSNDSLGFSLSAGAFVILLMTVTTVVGQLGGGYLADRTNKRLTIVFALLAQAVSLVVLALGEQLLDADRLRDLRRHRLGRARTGDAGDAGRVLRGQGLRDDHGLLVAGGYVRDDPRSALRGVRL